MNSLRLLLLALAIPLAAACAPTKAKMTDNAEAPYPPVRPPAVGDILHLATGYYVTEEQMLAVATDARIVYVGETHDNPASHRLELTVLRAMAERHPDGIALGMEMFTPDQQPVLDRWVKGELTEKEFIKLSRWHDQWRMDFEYYRPLLEFARQRGIPVIGLNAPKRLVKAATQNRLEELSEEDRQLLPEIDMADPYHHAFTTAIFGGHGHGDGGMDGFRRVQSLWDESMAESIVRFLKSPQGKNRRMAVVAGGNHVRHGFGIPRRVFRRLPTSYVTVGSKELVIPEEKRDRMMDVDVPHFPMIPYDFLLFTEYETLVIPGVRLGVLLDEVDGKVLAKSVLPGSVAETAGLREGDVFLDIDGVAVAESFDLIYEVRQRRPGDRSTLQIERAGDRQSIEVMFPAKTEEMPPVTVPPETER